MYKKLLLISIIALHVFAVNADNSEKTLVILNFADNYGLFGNKTEILTLLIFSKITNKTNKIQILERQELNSLQDEQIFTAKNAVTSVSEKKFSGAEYILNGKIYTIGNKISINAKLINCKTGKINGISRSYNDTLSVDDILEKFSDATANYIMKKLVRPGKKALGKAGGKQ
jgi:TolB-like protein